MYTPEQLAQLHALSKQETAAHAVTLRQAPMASCSGLDASVILQCLAAMIDDTTPNDSAKPANDTTAGRNVDPGSMARSLAGMMCYGLPDGVLTAKALKPHTEKTSRLFTKSADLLDSPMHMQKFKNMIDGLDCGFDVLPRIHALRKPESAGKKMNLHMATEAMTDITQHPITIEEVEILYRAFSAEMRSRKETHGYHR